MVGALGLYADEAYLFFLFSFCPTYLLKRAASKLTNALVCEADSREECNILLWNMECMWICYVRWIQVCSSLISQHGKNFEAIKAHLEKKHLSNKTADPMQVKTKEQVRYLYYRTWTKISKFIDQSEGE